MVDLCDGELSRRVRRVRRHAGALQRMKVDEAAPVLEFLLSTEDDADLVAAVRAVERERRESLYNVCSKVRNENSERLPHLRESTAEMLADAAEAEVAGWDPATPLHPGVLTEWALVSGSRAVAAAHLRALRRGDVVLAAMRGDLTMSLRAFLDASRLDSHGRRRLLSQWSQYSGPATLELLDLLVENSVSLAEWTFSHVPDDALERIARQEGPYGNVSGDVVVGWYASGSIDGWRLVSEPLTTRQRKRLAAAAARQNDVALVNTALARVEIDDSSYAGVDLADLLELCDSTSLSERALLIAAKECSPSQLMKWAVRAPGEQIRLVARRGGTEMARMMLNWHVPRLSQAAGVELLLDELITGPYCGEALRTSSDSIAARVAALLHERIGDDTEMWQIVLSFAGEWNATLDELLKSAAVCLGRK